MGVGTLTIPGLSLGPDRLDLVLEVVSHSGRGELLVREPITGALFELTVAPGAYAAVLRYDEADPEISEPRSIAIAGKRLSMLLRVRSALEEEERRREVPDGAPF
jgi:hypothetical protein